jgi:phosphatidylinositol alpha-mannosyltransferase
MLAASKRPEVMASAKLKIGLVADDTLDKPDGVQQYMLQIGGWLSRQGHEVHYLVGQSSRTDLPNVHSLSRNIPVSFNKNKLSVPLPANNRVLKKLLRTEQFDVLHVQMPYSPLLAGKLIKYAPSRTAVVGTFHILPFSGLERVATRALGLVLRRTLRRFDGIVAVSEPARQFAKSSMGITADVLPNVVDVEWYQQHIPTTKSSTGKLRIVYLGRLVARKGPLQLLKAVATLPTKLQANLEVIIGGKGPLLEELQQYVQSAGLKDIVTFAGFVADDDKPAFLNAADLAVFPSTGGESFGIVLIEAMAAKAGVVLGGNNPGYASVLAPWPEVIVEPDNTPVFATSLEWLLTNTAPRQRLYAAQQRAVTQYDVANVGPRLVQLYQKTVAKRRRQQDNVK